MNDFSKKDDKGNLISETNCEKLLDVLIALLCDVKLTDTKHLDEELLNSEKFQLIYNVINDLRDLTVALNKGDLKKVTREKGFILSNLKALQANLRHLTWQTQKIAEGDFSQKVEFLGDFSKAFNKMTFKLKENSEKLTNLASYDSLTQIPNRLSLDLFLEDSFSTNTEICILTIDIDRFKKINDSYGHDIGDLVLIHVSNILKKQFRSTDLLARYGGEEFTAVLPNTDIDTAKQIALHSVKAVRLLPLKLGNDIEIPVTISIGISKKAFGDTSFRDILKRSDEALYESKRNGRNKVTIINGI